MKDFRKMERKLDQAALIIGLEIFDVIYILRDKVRIHNFTFSSFLHVF